MKLEDRHRRPSLLGEGEVRGKEEHRDEGEGIAPWLPRGVLRRAEEHKRHTDRGDAGDGDKQTGDLLVKRSGRDTEQDQRGEIRDDRCVRHRGAAQRHEEDGDLDADHHAGGGDGSEHGGRDPTTGNVDDRREDGGAERDAPKRDLEPRHRRLHHHHVASGPAHDRHDRSGDAHRRRPRFGHPASIRAWTCGIT